ncbi:MAG TPA: hypothetical protein VIU15_35200 [Streptomyces sp.]
MAYAIEITRVVVSYRSPVTVTRSGRHYGGEWLDGDYRTLEHPRTRRFEYEDGDAWESGLGVVAWAVDVIGPTGATQPCVYPVGEAVPEWAWLSGRYNDPYEDDGRVTETLVRLTGDWSPQQRADVFHALDDD